MASAAEPSRGNTHAEQCALMKAGSAAEGCDVYCTMEPCSKRASSPVVRPLACHTHTHTGVPHPLACGHLTARPACRLGWSFVFTHARRAAACGSSSTSVGACSSERWSRQTFKSARACGSCRKLASTLCAYQLVRTFAYYICVYTIFDALSGQPSGAARAAALTVQYVRCLVCPLCEHSGAGGRVPGTHSLPFNVLFSTSEMTSFLVKHREALIYPRGHRIEQSSS